MISSGSPEISKPLSLLRDSLMASKGLLTPLFHSPPKHHNCPATGGFSSLYANKIPVCPLKEYPGKTSTQGLRTPLRLISLYFSLKNPVLAFSEVIPSC